MTIYIWMIFLYGAGFISFFTWPKQWSEGTLFNVEWSTEGVLYSIIIVITLFLIYKFVDSKYEIKRKSSWRDLN